VRGVSRYDLGPEVKTSYEIDWRGCGWATAVFDFTKFSRKRPTTAPTNARTSRELPELGNIE